MRVALLLMLVVGVAVSGPSGAATPDELRKVVEANKDVVVIVELVVEVKMTYEGQTEKQEHKGTATGTVIDPQGLTVMSLSEVDPSSQWSEGMMSSEKSSFTADVTSAKIKLSDGTEIPADVVLRDKDLDLAFVRPRKPLQNPIPFVDLAQSSSPQMFDEVIALGKLGRTSSFAIGATLERVVAVVAKPRTFFALTDARTGGPVFTLDGKVVGIALWRVSRSRDEEADYQIIALPAAAVAKGAEQAKTAEPVKPAPAPAPAPTPAPPK